MPKYQPYSRREYRRRFANWAKRNVRIILVLTGGMVGLVTLLTVCFLALPPSATTWWFLGVVQASVVALYLHYLNAAFLAADREAIWHLRGAWGEDNTRSELQRAKRKKLIWGWVDSINFQAGDLDHLVVTRQGGLVAIDSKWRYEASDTIDMARAARKARLRAQALAETLLKGERGARHRARGNAFNVTAVVVLWGAAQHHVPGNAKVDGVDFVAGRQLLKWLANLDAQPVDQVAAKDVLKRVEDFRATTWVATKATP